MGNIQGGKLKVPLPIDPYLEEILEAGQKHSTLLIKSSPGSGKTTRLPYTFARSLSGKVLVLEPRRLAAKLAAQRIAFEEALEIGKEVGYHFRFEKKVSTQTKVIFYTEGTFLRTLIQDPDLSEVEMVILDEFHERHLETDVALAALRSIQKKRPNFKIVLMSATLDTKIFGYFDNPKTIEIEAPRFKVDLHYLPNVPSELNLPLETKVKRAIGTFPDKGDVLVFLPGMREMLRTQDALGEQFGDVHLLHAELTKEEQERALTQGPRRRIILATNIAESSVTIPGIKYVIDSGIQRQAQYSAWTGLKTLVDRPITQSSAIQRAGRAGRTSDGVCFRLYSEQDFRERAPFTIPEILSADLTDTVLLVSDIPRELIWFTPPPEEHWKKALELNGRLGSLQADQTLSPLGKRLMAYPLDVRLARTLVAGEGLSSSMKRELVRFIAEDVEGDRFASLASRLSAFLQNSGDSQDPWEKALLAGFVDQVAKFRPKQHDFIHYSGKVIKAPRDQKEFTHDYYLILDVTARLEARLIVPIEEEWLYELDPFPFTESTEIMLEPKIQSRSQTKLGSIVVDEQQRTLSYQETSAELRIKVADLLETSARKLIDEFKESDEYGRILYASKFKNLDLEKFLEGLQIRAFVEEQQSFDLSLFPQHLKARLLGSIDQREFDQDFPEKIYLGGKRELKIHYPPGQEPFVEAPIQDFYGQKTTPTLLRGKIPLTLKLLGPHRMPIQVTKDLVNFWQKTYPEFKKTWLREYPRHHWPDDPTTAKPVLLKRMLE